MNWLIDTPINYWLLAFCMFGVWSLQWPLVLFGSGYAQTGVPHWIRRVLGAYYFPTGLLHDRIEKRPVSLWIRRVVNGLMLLNLLLNLAVVAFPFERLYSVLIRLIHNLFS